MIIRMSAILTILYLSRKLNVCMKICFYIHIYMKICVSGEWRKLQNEELRFLYTLSNIVRVVKSRRMRWAGNVARMGEGRGVYSDLVGKPEGKRPLGRPRRRW